MSALHPIMIVAGEASGDALAADLVKRVNAHAPKQYDFYGMAGPLMRAQGVTAMLQAEDMAVLGLWEVLCHIRTIVAALRRMKAVLRDQRPDMLVLIDYPGFNIKLAQYAKTLGIKVFYYVSPKVWVWKRGRLDTLAKCVDMMAVLHDFEVPLYQQKDIPVAYVGHYLMDELAPFVQRHPVVARRKCCRVALLPGSRASEIKVLMPMLMSVAKALHACYPGLEFILIQADFLPHDVFAQYLVETKQLPIRVVVKDHRQALAACDLALACSGTVTLELGILGIPSIVLYRLARVTYFLMRYFTKVRTASLVNLITKRDVYTELLQDNMTLPKILRAAKRYLDDEVYYRRKVVEIQSFQSALQTERQDLVAVFSQTLFAE